jgi:gamma-glutamyltranspeptidase/glutathione hydrolase
MASFLFFSAEGFAVQPVISNRDIVSPVQARNAMVVTGDPIATRIGLEVLKRGGNAVDAAVTIGFVMAVTNPRAGNIGGGGFMLIYGAKTGEVICIDYREKAPKMQ